MQITTLITLPEEVYAFYMNAASTLGTRTTEQFIVDTLTDFAQKAENTD